MTRQDWSDAFWGVIAILVFVLALAAVADSAYGQNIEGQPIASQYSRWQVSGYTPDTYNFVPTSCRIQGGASFFNAFSVGTPVKIVDGNPNLTEIVTPINVVINNTACSVVIAPSKHHNLPFYLTSATGGLQEAINANVAAPAANTIILDNGFYASVGPANVSAVINAAIGNSRLGLVDITQTPYVWYAWNGSAYAKVAVGGGVPSVNSITGATTIASGSNVTVATAGNTITVSAAGGAGTGAVGSGSQYQDTTYPNSGSAATVGALTNKYTLPTGLSTSQLDTWFSGLSTGTTTIQNGDSATPFTNPNFVGVQDLRETYPTSDWNVKESGAQCDLQGTFASLINGSTTVTSTYGYSFTAADVGKTIEIVGFDTSTNLPSRFDPTIVAVTSSTTATLSTASPFTASNYSMDIGHRDDAAIKSAFDHFISGRPITFPTGNCWSDTIAVRGQSFHGHGPNASLISGLAGDDVFSGLDPSQPGFQGMVPDMQISDMKWEFDPRINASRPWEDVNPSGTVTDHAATYRPEGLWTVWANYPLGPGWIQGSGPNNTGAINGVASTDGTTSIAITSATIPVAGQQIVFPYASTGVFTTTVSSASGSTLTLADAYPVSGSQTQQEWMAGRSVQEIETAIPSGTRAEVAISAYSLTSNVITFTATNSYSSGQTVNISGFPNSTFLNGQALTVISSGLSGSQFEAHFTHANASATEAGSASIFPFVLTLSNPITPPLTPNAAGTGSNVAPYGLVQIGEEQFSYFGTSTYPAIASAAPTITLTAGAQNGTPAAAHLTGATIVPLNPFQPTWPWPVTPSINAGVTPANAAYFPAWNLGNAAWAQPVYNGADWNPTAALAFSFMHDITMTAADFYPGGGGNGVEGGPNFFQESNATTGMYIATSTFKAKFANLHIVDPQFGIFEGTPSINVYGIFGSAYPTANGSSWQNITIQSAGYDTEFIEAQNDTKNNFLTFCQNGGETGTSYPGQPLGHVGCGAAWTWSGTYDDRDGGGGSDNTNSYFQNWYVEDEVGSQSGMQPYFEFNCGICTYGNGVAIGGGTTFVEGYDNRFLGNDIVGLGTTPLVNYGSATTMEHTLGAAQGKLSNTYGAGAFLNYGPNASVSGHTDGNMGPFGAVAVGNNLAPVTGQTASMFATGNDLGGPQYVSDDAAVIYPDQFNTNTDLEVDPMSVGWTFDDTAPVSHGYTACNTTDFGGCNTHAFNGDGLAIGPGEKIVPGHYIAHFALRTVGGANTLNLQFATTDIGAGCSSAATLYDQNLTTSATWTQYAAPIDFTGTSAGCGLNVWLNGTTTADQVRLAYLVFTPVWTNVTLPVDTPADNAVCTPGAFLGSDATYLYICTASGVVKRAVLSAY